MSDTKKQTPGLVTAIQVGIILLALGSFAISFVQIYGGARSAGILLALAVVYGVLAEGFIALATYVAWMARGQGWLQLFPWVVTAAGFSFSLWMNARTSENWSEGIIHGMPVLALPLAVHLLIVLTEILERNARKVVVDALISQAQVQAKKVHDDAAGLAAQMTAEAEAILQEAQEQAEEYRAIAEQTKADAIEHAEKLLDEAERKAAEIGPVVERVEVPQMVTPDIDPETVENPEAVAYKLLQHVHELAGNRQQVGYMRKRYATAMEQRQAPKGNIFDSLTLTPGTPEAA
ncbi:DUF2637 domain-containing protein [Actinoplanes sp. CA-054009]